MVLNTGTGKEGAGGFQHTQKGNKGGGEGSGRLGEEGSRCNKTTFVVVITLCAPCLSTPSRHTHIHTISAEPLYNVSLLQKLFLKMFKSWHKISQMKTFYIPGHI